MKDIPAFVPDCARIAPEIPFREELSLSGYGVPSEIRRLPGRGAGRGTACFGVAERVACFVPSVACRLLRVSGFVRLPA